MNIQEKLAQEFHIKTVQAENTVALIDEGNTIPFIARYRKEATGGLSDVTLRGIEERLNYLRSLEERKEEVKTKREEAQPDNKNEQNVVGNKRYVSWKRETESKN